MGRTKPGSIVTNAKGSSYSSMHQWGVAFDIVVEMDCDKDGDIDIKDLYNAKLLKKVGRLSKQIKLEWGGNWKSIVDTPHYQLKDWGSTPAKLKIKYKTFDRFKRTWKNYKGAYIVKENEVKIYNHPWKARRTVGNLKLGDMVICDGEYDVRNGKTYLYVKSKNKSGFVLKSDLLGGGKK